MKFGLGDFTVKQTPVGLSPTSLFNNDYGDLIALG